MSALLEQRRIMALEFGYRTGDVDFLDWDDAMIRGFGALHDAGKNEFYLPLNGIFVRVEGRALPVDKALVVYKRPEPTQIEATLPMIAVIRDSVVPADIRLQSPTVQYRLPSEGAQRVSAGGILGWTNYDTKDFEQPYDMFYTFECWSRYRSVSQMLLSIVMRAFPIHSTVTLTDGLGNPRTYALFQQGINDLTDVSSVVERVPGYALSLRAEAELTLDREPFSVPAFTGTRTKAPLPGTGNAVGGYRLVPGPGGIGLVPADQNGYPLAGGGVGDPDPGPGGLYGTGLPIVREGVYKNLEKRGPK
jgi:hypothetical protein